MTKTKIFKTFVALLLLGLLPAIYDTLKVAFVNNSSVSINVFGQIEWFDLINETITMFLITPLYCVFNKSKELRINLSKLLIVLGLIYAVFIGISITQINNLTGIMNASGAEYYLFLESVGFIFNFVYSFSYVYFVVKEDYRTIYKLLGVKLATMIGYDILLNSLSAEYGAIYAGMLSQLTVSIYSLLVLVKKKALASPFNGDDINIHLAREFFRIGFFLACTTFIANVTYAKCIMGFINNIEMAGVYWIANNFIWGYLLLPINSLGEIVKSEANKNNFKFKNYFLATGVIVLTLLVFSPLYDDFLITAMQVKEIDLVLGIIKTLSVFYIAYMFNVVIDSYFIGKGKTYFPAIPGLIVNLIYYPIAIYFNVFSSDLTGICYLFGFGMLINFFISLAMFFVAKIATDYPKTVKN